MRILLIATFLLSSSALCLSADDSNNDTVWTTDSFTKRVDAEPLFDPFYPPVLLLDGLFWDGRRLRGGCIYTNLTSSIAILEGRQIDEAIMSSSFYFYPDVSLQVSNDKKGEWKTIGTSPSPDRGKAIAVSMAPNGPRDPIRRVDPYRACYVEMDPFRPLIGKFVYGRLALKNGGTSQVFELTELLPPKNQNTPINESKNN